MFRGSVTNRFWLKSARRSRASEQKLSWARPKAGGPYGPFDRPKSQRNGVAYSKIIGK